MKKQGEELLAGTRNENAVKALQNAMNERGFTDKKGDRLWEDGIYGANTANAVIKYQRANGLPANGITDDTTWNHIYNKKRKKEEDATQNQTFYDVWKGRNASSADVSEDEESFHDRVRKRWENGTRGTLPEMKNYDARKGKGEKTDYSGIFASGKENGKFALSGDTAPGISPAPIPRYNPTGRAFNNYAVSDEGMPSVSGDNYGRALPESAPVSGDDIFATDKPKLQLMSDTGSKESDESKEDSNWLWDYIKNPKEAVIRFAKEAGKTIYEAQKELQRKVWRYGADNYLKEIDCPVSAYMLEHSLQDNPTTMTFGNESDIAKLIVKDPVYLNALDEAIANSDGKTIDTDLEDIAFETDDLYYSIHRATIHVKGYKNKDGKWIITAMLEDTYDFTEWMTVKVENGKLSFDIRPGTVANDAAKVSQFAGGINPYMVRVYFNTIR